MKIYKQGDRSKAFCKKCKKNVTTTFIISSLPLSSKKAVVNDILCASCDVCHSIVSIPQQSSPRIKEVMERNKYSIEVRLPRHLLDILLLAVDRFDLGSPDLLKDTLIKYYIGLAGENKRVVQNIKKFSSSDFAKGSNYRLSLKVSKSILDVFDQIMKDTSLNRTQVLKGIILQINEDLLQNPSVKRQKELRKILLISA